MERAKGRVYRKTEFGQDAVIVVEEVIFVRSQKCPYHVTFDLDLEHTLDARSSGDHCVQVWSQSNYLPARRSNFRASTKVPGSRDLDLEHTLDACSPVQVWSQSSHLCRSRSDLCKTFTGGRTDRRRTPYHCISSRNELENSRVHYKLQTTHSMRVLQPRWRHITNSSHCLQWRLIEEWRLSIHHLHHHYAH